MLSNLFYIFTGGMITRTDLNGYRALLEPPVVATLSNGNYTLLSPQPPSSGVVLQHILKILDGKHSFRHMLYSCNNTIYLSIN